MRPQIRFALIAASAVTATGILATAGTLTPPPGPVTPTGPVRIGAQTTLPYTISQPGSYLLTANLTGVANADGIIIDADNVTLDLNGFALIGVKDSMDAIHASGHNAIHVTNESVRDWGVGVYLTGPSHSSTVDHVTADANGIGIDVSEGQVSHCIASDSSFGGIELDNGNIAHCVARNNTNFGIYASSGSVSDCTAYSQATGIYVVSGSAQNCFARTNTIRGFFLGGTDHAVTITGCTATDNDGDGFYVAGNCTISNTTSDMNGADGIHVLGSNSRIDSSNVAGNTGVGIHIEGTGNVAVRNTARGNQQSDYNFTGGNAVAQVLNVSGSAFFTSTDPWANFTY